MPDLFTQIEFFREALAFTSQRYGFPERLIENDYVCTLLLEVLTAAHDGLVFKGGTCLAKVYADFYRMSEDLGHRELWDVPQNATWCWCVICGWRSND